MFGQNSIAHQTREFRHLAVESAFYTLQGEGPFSGMPALFIRLAGCNLACHFCDTQFETQLNNLQPVGEIMQDLLSRFTPAQRRLVVLTGGEPFRQNFSLLARGLYSTGTKMIQIETAGTLWQAELDPWLLEEQMVIVCSPKTPAVHPQIITNCFHWKYIITAGEQSPFDGLPIRGTQMSTRETLQKLYRANPVYGNTVWVSPCDSYDPAKNEANVIAARDAALKYGYRLSLQMHKIVGVE